MFLCLYSLLMRQERGVSGCVHWCVGPCRVLNACECMRRCSEPSAHHRNMPCNNRIMTVEIRAPAGSLVFMGLWRQSSNTDQTRPSCTPLIVFFFSLSVPRTLTYPPIPSSQRHGPQTPCCQGWRGHRGQRCLLEVRFRQWAHLIGPSGRVTWHN